MLLTIFNGAMSVVVSILVLGWWINGYFRRRGVKTPPTCLPFIGNIGDILRQKMHTKDLIRNVYNSFPDEKYIGIFQFTNPLLIIKDLDLIRKVTIKDFDYFQDRSLEESGDLVFGKSLISLHGQKWRDMRATLSPAFTSSKMRGMFQFIVDCGEQMADYYVKEMDKENNKVQGLIELEIKDAFTRYANDVIATIAFGLDVNSFSEKNNTFYLMGKDSADTTGIRFLKIFVLAVFPKLAKLFHIHYLSEKTESFFRCLVWDTIKEREKQNIIRNDMLQLLMKVRKGTLKYDAEEESKETGFAAVEESFIGKRTVKRDWSDDEILAQAVLFFIAGFDAVSTLLSFLSYELAIHPQIQKRLHDEIDQVTARIDGKLTYESLHKMKYLDMVVSEALRLWPQSVIVDRKCTNTYTMPPPNEKSSTEYTVNIGDIIYIPVYGLHLDPKYYKNPDVFDPERFSDENKNNIVPGTYIPFGIGPRNCIGSRFALMEVKSVIFNILLKFEIVTTVKTQIPIQIKNNTFNLQAQKGFWVGLKLRNK